jgi:hypothetical protein
MQVWSQSIKKAFQITPVTHGNSVVWYKAMREGASARKRVPGGLSNWQLFDGTSEVVALGSRWPKLACRSKVSLAQCIR